MSKVLMSDLRASPDLLCAITIRTWTGHEFLTGAKDLNEAAEHVVVYNPQTLGNTHTTQTMLLSLVPASVGAFIVGDSAVVAARQLLQTREETTDG